MKKIILLFFLLCFSIKGNSQTTYAVIVGIADYQNNQAGFKDLTWTINDTKKISNFLMSKEGGSVPSSNIYVLTEEKAKKANIIFYAKKLFDKAKEEDKVIFFFSGHGMPGAFLPYDFNPTNTDNFLSYDEVKSIFKASKSKTKILYADACYAGALKDNKKAVSEENSNNEKGNDKSDVVIMLSCSENETSLESGETKQGLFSYFLIHGLKGYADLNKDNQITIDELHKYVYGKTVKAAKKRNNKQHPMTFGDFDKNLVVSKVYK